MDVETVDQEYQQLEQESQQLTQAIQEFAGKLQERYGMSKEDAERKADEWVSALQTMGVGREQPTGARG